MCIYICISIMLPSQYHTRGTTACCEQILHILYTNNKKARNHQAEKRGGAVFMRLSTWQQYTRKYKSEAKCTDRKKNLLRTSSVPRYFIIPAGNSSREAMRWRQQRHGLLLQRNLAMLLAVVSSPLSLRSGGSVFIPQVLP